MSISIYIPIYQYEYTEKTLDKNLPGYLSEDNRGGLV